MDYVEIEAARKLPGLRLVLTPGVPGPWGEAAKSLFQVKGIEFVPVRQPSEQEDRTGLVAWTLQTSAPVAMYEDERPRSSWESILFLAERLAPTPSLIPADPAARTHMFGLCREICGEHGLGWSRRLHLLPPQEAMPPETMAWKYGIAEQDAKARSTQRIRGILELLHQQLLAQRDAGREYLVGDALTALDVYWACFSNMLVPLPHAQSPMPDWMRPIYTAPEEHAPHPDLIEHRDAIFTKHLRLPQEF